MARVVAQQNFERALSAEPVGLGYMLHKKGLSAQAVAEQVKAVGKTGFTQPLVITNVVQSVPFFPVDLGRKFFFIENHDPLGNITVSFGVARAFGIGLRAAAGGGSILLDITVPTAEIYIIGDIASNANVSCMVF